MFPETAPEVETGDLPLAQVAGPLLGPDPASDLVESVKQVGILVPIIVQRVAEDAEAFYVVDGRRRLKAAKDAGLDTVPCRILPADVANPEAFTLQANLTRKANPVSEYVAIRDLVKRGFSERDIAKHLGIKAAVITQRLVLGNLVPTLYELLESGRIAVSVGEAAAKLPPSIQEQLLQVFADNDDRLTLKDVQEVKRVRRETNAAGLSDLLFGDGEKKRTDARTALSHLDAAEALLTSLGEKVDFAQLRGRIGQMIE